MSDRRPAIPFECRNDSLQRPSPGRQPLRSINPTRQASTGLATAYPQVPQNENLQGPYHMEADSPQPPPSPVPSNGRMRLRVMIGSRPASRAEALVDVRRRLQTMLDMINCELGWFPGLPWRSQHFSLEVNYCSGRDILLSCLDYQASVQFCVAQRSRFSYWRHNLSNDLMIMLILHDIIQMANGPVTPPNANCQDTVVTARDHVQSNQ